MDSSKVNSDQIVSDSILKVGYVVSIAGRVVKVSIDKSKNVSHLLFNGTLVKNISVGGYVKVRKGFETIVGKIEGEYVDEEAEIGKDYVDKRERINRILEIKLLGYYDGRTFKKGIKELPLMGNECFLLTREEYADVHNFIKDGDVAMKVGCLSNDHGTEIRIGVNSLFASHIGIFGNTGSGKSYTLTALYNQLFRKFGHSENFRSNARFLLIDFNGEYINRAVKNDSIIADDSIKKSYQLSTRSAGDQLPLPSSAVFDELIWIIAAEATEKTQTPFLRRALSNKQFEQATQSEEGFKKAIVDIFSTMATSKDPDFLSSIHSLLKDLSPAIRQYSKNFEVTESNVTTRIQFFVKNSEYVTLPKDSSSKWTYANNVEFKKSLLELFKELEINTKDMNIFNRIYAIIVLHFYREISLGYSNREHIGPMLKRLEKRVNDLSKVLKLEDAENKNDSVLTIISLRDVNIHMRKILPLMVCRHLYEEKKHQENKKKYLNLIIDEAHNVLSDSSMRENEEWKDYRLETFEEIIKEGRKFGTFLTIASQRPSDISTTIVSQLHNYFLHRLVNEKDLKAIESTISFLDKVSFEMLPILPTGSCVVSGLISQVPVIIEVDPIDEKSQPQSETYKPTDHW
ncbi:hypothetical protein BDW_13410 [Bdellovibrio bacteriovorus W]|nr:hypothetical protein BDW_13410 [Bdellovibrio bacteriovorus W]